jgi:hypothetical protein
VKDIYDILRSKEFEMENLAIEIEALRVVAPLLSDDEDSGGDSGGDSGNDRTPVSTASTPSTRPLQVPRAANADPQPERSAEWKERAAGFP